MPHVSGLLLALLLAAAAVAARPFPQAEQALSLTLCIFLDGTGDSIMSRNKDGLWSGELRRGGWGVYLSAPYSTT